MQTLSDNMNAPTTDTSINNNDVEDDNSQSGDGEMRDGQHHPVAEFLYQLTKMLTDDNSEIIEWVDGRIKVHHPERLEAEVLHKYFRHSKFASFQRQLNYFGFRKIAGKGKMSPCSYVNDAATADIRSLLLIKRKTNGSAARKAAMQQRAAALNLSNFPFSALAANPAAMAAAASLNPQALTSAMALLSDSALRNGFLQQVSAGQQQSTQLGLLALQQQQLQQQQQQQQQQDLFQQHQQQQQNLLSSMQSQQRPSETTSDHHQQALQHQQQLQQLQQRFQGLTKSQSNSSQGPVSAPAPTSGSIDTSSFAPSSAPQPAPSSGTPSLEQLHANLAASLTGQLGSFNNFGSFSNNVGSASAALANAQRQTSNSNNSDNPATKALQSMSATAAANAESSSARTAGGSIFESALNLESLLQEYQANESRAQREQEQQRKTLAGSFHGNAAGLMNRLPSSGTIFPSSASFGRMGDLGMGSSNRLSSLLSLSSLVNSREASLADLAAQLPGNRVAAGLQSFGAPMDANGRYRN
eukprot:scaffold190_cov171-Amphora_coffeaeformis.AAC.27